MAADFPDLIRDSLTQAQSQLGPPKPPTDCLLKHGQSRRERLLGQTPSGARLIISDAIFACALETKAP